MSRKHGAPFVWREGDGYVMMLMGHGRRRLDDLWPAHIT
jgi:hypothetical protein